MSNPIPAEVAKEIANHVFSGQMIQAIKIYREHSGKHLKEAKEFVESLEDELRAKEPDKFSTQAAGKGCLTTVVAFGFGTLTVVHVLVTVLHG